MRRVLDLFALAVFVMLPAAASAHVGIGDAHGFVHGFSHPLGGIDHILTMVAVGLLAAHLGRRALWLVPLSFIVVMAIGGWAGMAGIAIPFVEVGIGLSVVVLGAVVALQLNLPTLAMMALVGFFAIFHGHAHGAETPETEAGLMYAIGFICATGLLHSVGIGLGLAASKTGRPYTQRIVQGCGVAISLAGGALLLGVI